MKLYLQVNMPQGKTLKIKKLGERAIDPSAPIIILYPDKPTEVEDKWAIRLMAQEPHLVGQKQKDPEDFPVTYPTPEAQRIAELEKENAKLRGELASAKDTAKPAPKKAKKENVIRTPKRNRTKKHKQDT